MLVRVAPPLFGGERAAPERRRGYNPMVMPPTNPEPPPAKTLRLGPFGAATAVLVLVSLILAAIFCAFPWGMKVP